MRNKIAIKYEACRIGVQPEALAAFIKVESGGRGFDRKTGKIIIQFEPVWFRRKAPYAPSGKWSVNKVERQDKEWIAFNDAFYKDANAAMESTSIGIGQIMGFHYKRLGYASVGDMWDDAKNGEDRQIFQMAEFIKTDPILLNAIKRKDWHTVAIRYNGSKYKELAKIYNREPYNIAMKREYNNLINKKVFQ